MSAVPGSLQSDPVSKRNTVKTAIRQQLDFSSDERSGKTCGQLPQKYRMMHSPAYTGDRSSLQTVIMNDVTDACFDQSTRRFIFFVIVRYCGPCDLDANASAGTMTALSGVRYCSSPQLVCRGSQPRKCSRFRRTCCAHAKVRHRFPYLQHHQCWI